MEDAVLDGGQRTSGLNEEIVAQYLKALGCALQPTGGDPGEFGVTLPSWRLDLEREIDVIEEVARVYGYNRFADTLPGWSGEVHDAPGKAQEEAIRLTLRGLGYTEAISSTFTSAAEAAIFGAEGKGTVAIGNPLSEEAGMLRPSLVAGMAGMLGRNLARDASAVRLFELGTIFTGSTAEVQERPGLAMGATGGVSGGPLHGPDDALLFEVKGAIETLVAKFGGDLRFEAGSDGKPLPAWIEAGRGGYALLDGVVIGVFGELSGAESAARKLRQSCVLAELDAARLLRTPLRQPVLQELSRYLAVDRAFSFIFPDSIPWGAIETRVRAAAPPELQRVQPLEIFRDPKGRSIPPGSYSLLTRVVFQSNERTLTEDELTSWSESITRGLTELGGKQRVRCRGRERGCKMIPFAIRYRESTGLIAILQPESRFGNAIWMD